MIISHYGRGWSWRNVLFGVVGSGSDHTSSFSFAVDEITSAVTMHEKYVHQAECAIASSDKNCCVTVLILA
jgi:hypothetical protein